MTALVAAACSSFDDAADSPGPSPSPVDDAGSDTSEARIDSGAADAPIDVAVDTGPSASSIAYRAAVMQDKPIAYWRLSEPAASVSLASEVGAHTFLPGAVKPSFGVAGLFSGTGGAIGLGGTNGMRVFSNTVPMLLPNAFSFETWINLGAPADDSLRTIFAQANASSSVVFYVMNTGLVLECVNMMAHFYANMPPLSTGAWHHVVAQATTVAAIEIYVDGSKSLTATSNTQVPDAPGEFTVGARDNGAPALGPNAKLAEIALYDHVLTPDRITEHIVLGKTP